MAKPAASPPGTLVAPEGSPRPTIQVCAYGPEGLLEATVDRAEDLAAYRDKQPVLWVNVDGLGDVETISTIGRIFGLHRLALEDVLSLNQRAKAEPYDDLLYIVLRRAFIAESGHLGTEQISLFLGPGLVLSFQEDASDDFAVVRERIRKARGRVRTSGADYLLYALVDCVIDGFLPALQEIGDRLESLEEEIVAHATPDTLARIHRVKRDLITLRHAVWPHREALSTLIREPLAMFQEETRVHLRDCADHVVRTIDLVETSRELAASLLDVYLSSVSNRMNEVMKVLTIISTIFIPLTFLTSIYGMNFDPDVSRWNMPELRWPWGYPAVMGLVVVTAAALVFGFWKMGWIGKRAWRRKAIASAGHSPGASGDAN